MSETDYSHYRLQDDDDFVNRAISRFGLNKILEFEAKVYSALDKLKVGKYYEVGDMKEEQIEPFIKISCMYIRQHPEVVFNETYTRIYKEVNLYEPRKMDQRRKEVRDRQRR